MILVFAAVVLGCAAGSRTMTPLAAVAFAARAGIIGVADSPLAFIGYRYAFIITAVLAIGELVNDKMPWTPSRKVPPQFIGRILCGALAGACVAAPAQMLIGGLVGAVAAVAGTLGGAAARGRLAARFGRDLPAALIEDAVTVALCVGTIYTLA